MIGLRPVCLEADRWKSALRPEVDIRPGAVPAAWFTDDAT